MFFISFSMLLCAQKLSIEHHPASMPCIRLARGKFELTNQHSAGGKIFSVLSSSKQVRKGTEIKPLFSLAMALNIHKKGLAISKTISDCKK